MCNLPTLLQVGLFIVLVFGLTPALIFFGLSFIEQKKNDDDEPPRSYGNPNE